MISEDKQFIFIQVPKTGCTSIQRLLSRHGGISVQGAENWNNPNFKHITYSELQALLPAETIDQYFKFTFIRNPYDWLVSNYTFHSKGVHVPYLKRYGYKSWEEWANRDGEILPQQLSFRDWLYWCVDNMHGTQWEMIVDTNNKIDFDFIGSFENLQQDYNIVCDKIGIPQQQLPHVNKTNHRHYTEYYDEELYKFVQDKYKQDFELLDYAKQYHVELQNN